MPGDEKKSAKRCASCFVIILFFKSFIEAFDDVLYPPKRPAIIASMQFPESPNNLFNGGCIFFFVFSLKLHPMKIYETISIGNMAGTIVLRQISIAETIEALIFSEK